MTTIEYVSYYIYIYSYIYIYIYIDSTTFVRTKCVRAIFVRKYICQKGHLSETTFVRIRRLSEKTFVRMRHLSETTFVRTAVQIPANFINGI